MYGHAVPPVATGTVVAAGAGGFLAATGFSAIFLAVVALILVVTGLLLVRTAKLRRHFSSRR